MAPISAFEDLFDDKDESKRGAPTGSAFEGLFADEPAIDSRQDPDISEIDLVDAFNTGDYTTIDEKYAAGLVENRDVPPRQTVQEDADAQVGFVFPDGPEEGPAVVENLVAERVDTNRSSVYNAADRLKIAKKMGIDPEDLPEPTSTLKDVGSIKDYATGTVLSYKQAARTMEKGRIGHRIKLGTATDADMKRLKVLSREIAEIYEQAKSKPFIAKSFGQLAPFLLNSVQQGGKGALLGAIIGGSAAGILGNLAPGALGLAEEVLTIPGGAAIGAKIGGSFASVSDIAEIEGGSAFLEMTEMGMDPDKAGWASDIVGTGSGMLELAQFRMLKRLLPGSDKLASGIVARAFRRVLANTRSGRAISKIGGAAIPEAGVETLQEFWGNISEVVATDIKPELDKTDLSPQSKKEYIDRLTQGLVETFATTVTGFGVAAIPGAAINVAFGKPTNAGTQQSGTTDPSTVKSEGGVSIVTPVESTDTPISQTSQTGRQSVRDLLGSANAGMSANESNDGVMTTKQAVTKLAENDAEKATEELGKIDRRANKIATTISNLEATHDNLNAFYEKAVEEGDVDGAVEVAGKIRETVDQLGKEYTGLVEATNLSMTHKNEEIDPNIVLDLQDEIKGKIEEADTKVLTSSNMKKQVQLEANQTKIEKLGTETGLKDELIGAQVAATRSGDSKVAKLHELVITEMNDKEVMGKKEYDKQSSLKKMSALRSKIGAQIALDRVDPDTSPDQLAQNVASLQWIDEQIVEKQEHDLRQEEIDLKRERLKAAGVVDRPTTVERPKIRTVKKPKGPAKPPRTPEQAKTASQKVAEVARKRTRESTAKKESLVAAKIRAKRVKDQEISRQQAKVRKEVPTPPKAPVEKTKAIQTAAVAKQLKANDDLVRSDREAARKSAPKSEAQEAPKEAVAAKAKSLFTGAAIKLGGVVYTKGGNKGHMGVIQANPGLERRLASESTNLADIESGFISKDGKFVPGAKAAQMAGGVFQSESFLQTAEKAPESLTTARKNVSDAVGSGVKVDAIGDGTSTLAEGSMQLTVHDKASPAFQATIIVPQGATKAQIQKAVSDKEQLLTKTRAKAIQEDMSEAGVESDLSVPSLAKSEGTLETLEKLATRMKNGPRKWLYDMLRKSGFKFRFVNTEDQVFGDQDWIKHFNNPKAAETKGNEFNKKILGLFAHNVNTAFINMPLLTKITRTLERLEETVTHEAVHGVVRNLINKMTDAERVQFNTELQALWDGMDQEMIESVYNDPTTNTVVKKGIEQIREFGTGELIAYSFANKPFAEWLNTVPASGAFQQRTKKGTVQKLRSVWQALQDLIITKVIKVPSRHDELVDIMNTFMSATKKESISREAQMGTEAQEAFDSLSKDGLVVRAEGKTDRSAESVTNMKALTRDDSVYRGMTAAEFDNTLGSGKGVDSNNQFSFGVEGTSFAEHFDTSESYVDFGRDDPRTTGKPNYVIEVTKGDHVKRNIRGDYEAQGEVSLEHVTRVWKINPIGTELIATDITASVARERRFSISEDGAFDFGENVTPQTVAGWISDINAPGAADMVVVKNSQEFEDQFGFTPPENVPSVWLDSDKGKLPRTTKRIIDPGRPAIPQQVVFIADRIQSQEHFMLKYLHEQAGHVGLRNLFGKNSALMNRFLDQAYNLFAMSDKKVLDDILETYSIGNVDPKTGNRILTPNQKREAAEEVIAGRAHILRPPTKKGLTKRFKTFLNRWLPKNFVAEVNKFKLTDQDVWTIIEASRESVFTGDTRLGKLLSNKLSERRPTKKFPGWKTLPPFMKTNKEYRSWAKEVAKAVPSARMWYEQHVELIKKLFGRDAGLFTVLLAMTSPQADVATNVVYATQSYLYALGLADKPGHRFPAPHKAKLDLWKDAMSMMQTIESKTFKVPEFIRALLGDRNATVGDIWMYRAFFGDHAVHNNPNENLSVSQQVALRQKLHDLAAELTEETGSNWSPREVQASLWVYINAKENGRSFDVISNFMSGFNKPSPVFDGLTPLEYIKRVVPDDVDGPLATKLGLDKITQAPVSTLEKKLTLQMQREGNVKKYPVTRDAAIRLLSPRTDTRAVASMIQAIADGGRTLTAQNEQMAKWYKETFGFEVVDGLEMRLSDEATSLYTDTRGVVKTNLVRDNLGGFAGNFVRTVRFSREARRSLDQITEMSTVEQDAEFIRTGNDGMSVTGKIHEWRDQSELNINRLTDNLEQDFLEKFGGRKARQAVRKLGFASGKFLNTGNTEILQRAMNLYIDSGTGENLIKAKEYAKELANNKRKTNDDIQRLATIERMLMLSDEEKSWADSNIRSYYDEFFEFAQENGIIDSHIDNYVKRLWKMPDEFKDSQVTWNGGSTTGFKVKSDSGKQRSLDSIIDGWRNGFQLTTEAVIPNLQAYATEIGYVHANRRFVDYMKSLITFGEESDGLMAEIKTGDRVPQGYKQITDRGFAAPGTVLVARGDIADVINKMGDRPTHKLWDIPIIRGIRRINAMIKSTILSVSLYHHFAGMRSYVFGVRGKGIKLNPISAYKRGLKKIDEKEGFTNPDYTHLGPIVDLLVREGLTIGKTQDWDENALMDSFIEESLKKRSGKVTGAALKGWQGLRRFRRQMTTGLFGRLFAGLKAESGAIELVHNIKKMEKKLGRVLGDEEIKLQAQHTARVINADFGGLHLRRRGRNPDLQRMAQMMLLAPDWTESNWRTVTGMIPGMNKVINKMISDNPAPPGMGKVYRRFWRGIALRGLISVALTNAAILTLFGDDDDREDYFDMVQEQLTWKNFAKGKWLSVPLGPVYKTLGIEQDPDKRSLLSVVGHFKDILKVADLRTLVKHKISPAARIFETLWSGTDWKGARFTSLPELIETGKLTVDNRFAERLSGPGEMTTFASLALYNLRQSVPIFTSEGLMALNGESRMISAVMRSSGLDVRDTRREPVNQQKYAEVNSDILELDRNLKEAQLLKDREAIAKARSEIKSYPNFNRTKSRLGVAKQQLASVNSQMKRLVLRQDAGQTLTLLEERRLKNLRDRKQRVYDKFVQIIER